MVDQPRGHLTRDLSDDSINDAEKGMYERTTELQAPLSFAYISQQSLDRSNSQLSPLSPVHEGITPNPSIPDLSLSWPAASPAVRRGSINATALQTTVPKKPTPAKPKIPRWVLADLWFNTYRKFFTFIILLNMVGIIMTALGRFPYAENHLGALVLGNLLSAVLFRNELWMRFLYLVAIYGLRSVSRSSLCGNNPVANRKLASGLPYASSMQLHQFCSMLGGFIRDVLYPAPRKENLH
jgi:hypothetical protein